MVDERGGRDTWRHGGKEERLRKKVEREVEEGSEEKRVGRERRDGK